MTKAVLHIGSAKTGTSALQSALAGSYAANLARGICYPVPEAECHHLFFFATKLGPAHWPRQFRNFSSDRLKRDVAGFFDKLSPALREAHPVYILSSEYLFLADEQAIANAVEFLSAYVDEIEAVVYLRDPADYYSSYEQQMLKARSHLTGPGRFTYPMRAVIEAWQAFVPVRVAGFERGTDILAHFRTDADLPSLALEGGTNRNESLSIEQMALLEKLRRVQYADQDDRFLPHHALIPQLQPRRPHKPVLKPEIAGYLRYKHREDLAWLARHWGIDLTQELPDTPPALDQRLAEAEHCALREVFEVDEAAILEYETYLLDELLNSVWQ